MAESMRSTFLILQAEATFKTFANKDGLVSQLDVIAIVRSMGMNPNDDDLTDLIDAMQIRDPEREKMVEPSLQTPLSLIHLHRILCVEPSSLR